MTAHEDEIEYQNRLFETLRTIKEKLDKILKQLYFCEIIDKKFQAYKQQLLGTACNRDKLKHFHHVCFIK